MWQALLFELVWYFQVAAWLIEPSTREHKCSLVELMCPVGTVEQKPTVFVSHVTIPAISELAVEVKGAYLQWWGEATRDYVKAVQEHAKVRRLELQDQYYWTCVGINSFI